MIKFASRNKQGRPLIGFGLSFANLARLQQQRPIVVDGRELGVDAEILIFAGETEEAMLAEMVERGLLPSEAHPDRLRRGDCREWRPPSPP